MTDLATAIEQHIADRPKNPKPEPITIDITGPHTKLIRTSYAWRAWMEDSDMWDGCESYDQMDTALLHAALSYVDGEYPTPEPDDDPEEFAKPGPLAWVHEHGTWHLNDNGHDTMVRVYLEAIYGLPAASDPTRLAHEHIRRVHQEEGPDAAAVVTAYYQARMGAEL